MQISGKGAMKVTPYYKEHYEEVASWFEKRGLPPIPETSLPKHGFMVLGIGAIFLYSMDCDVCQIETAITNPEIDKEIRSQAIDAVTEAALKKAKELGFRTAISYTCIDKIKKQAVGHGYEIAEEPYALMWRNLWAG